MKKIISLISLALVAASFSAFAQNTNEAVQQAQQQVQQKQDALNDAERGELLARIKEHFAQFVPAEND